MPATDIITNPAIWCGIPVCNNAGTIVDIARRTREQIANVLVIDDGSTDADLTELLKSLDVIVIRHPTNLGKGKALLTAFKYAAEHGAQYLITLDGDGQHFPEDIARFVPHLSPDKILIGYRDEITGEMPGSSRFGRELSDFWIRLEAGGNARDTQSGFRAYPLPAVLRMKIDSRFYNFEMEIITRALWAGLRVGNVPIRVWYPPAAERVSSFDPLIDNLRISLLHARLLLRQILPVPHRRMDVYSFSGRPAGAPDCAPSGRPLNEEVNIDPTSLAVSAALSIIMAIVLWPWGIFPVAYVTIRLHLNKMIALVCVAACMPMMVPSASMWLGRLVIQSDAHPHLQWIAGSHLLAVPLAVMAGAIVYAVGRARMRKSSS